MKMERKLSQIILYVDDRLPKEDICTFRTNILKSKPDFWFTYLNYDNQSYEKWSKKDEILFITDHEDMARKVFEEGIAVAGLLTKYNKNDDFSYLSYCIENIEDISYEIVDRIWRRLQGIPWEITTTDRMIIREQIIEDLDDIVRMYADKDTTLYMDNIYEDIELEREYMREYIASQYAFFEYGIWTLIDKKSGEYVGRAGLSLREGFDDVEIGYVITKKYRNKGYAKEAIQSIMNYAKEELELSRLIAFVRPQNIISINLLEKMGFYSVKNHEIDGIIHVMYCFDL